mgnify:CR=1 FL=1
MFFFCFKFISKLKKVESILPLKLVNKHQINCEIITDFNVKNHLFLWKFSHYKSSRTSYNNSTMDKTNIDTGKIAEILNKFLELKSLKDRCTTRVPELPAFCEKLKESKESKTLKELDKEIKENKENKKNRKEKKKENLFEQNKSLKENLKECFKSPDFEQNKIELINYIVKTWGGIRNLKNYRTIENDIASVKQPSTDQSTNQVDNMRISGDYIPSRSKVLSFLNPEEYVICDSRVIFSLNWLLFITGPKEQFVQFSKLEPRNKTCEIYSLSYLLEKYNLQPAEEKTQYKEFIEVIKALTDKLKEKQGDDWKIYCTEMLLFQIADDLEYGIPCLVRELLLNKDAVNNFSYENAIEL